VKNNNTPKDQAYKMEKDIQKMTDSFIDKIKGISDSKEKEILTA